MRAIPRPSESTQDRLRQTHCPIRNLSIKPHSLASTIAIHLRTLFAVFLIQSSVFGSEIESFSFRRDVMPVFFRAGCNAGTCHGSARGKDGFMLSLFGYDSRGDYFRIVNEMIGRRINVAVPEQSLLLKKAIGAVPHTGGELFTSDSDYYKTLLRWIELGAPDDTDDVASTVGIELSTKRFIFEETAKQDEVKVTAIYDDGSRRNVTHLARFHSNNSSIATIDEQGLVTAQGPGDTHVFARFSRFTAGVETIVLPPAENFHWPSPKKNNYIDELVLDRLQKLRIAPSELCDDETFLRRVTLDLVARPPTVEEYHDFMEDPTPEKRALKIEQLLQNNAFADFWTARWSEQLRIIGGNYAPQGTHIKAANAFQEWIRRQIRSGRPLNEMVNDMVISSGSNLQNGPVNLYTMLVHAPRLDPKAFAADFSQLFLGIQIQCAECHNHPFDRWTMDDYYGFVSFFSGVRRKPGVETREQRIYYDPKAAPARHLVDQRPMPAKVLGALQPVQTGGDPRRALATWLTSPENEHFSRNLANRIWAQLFGRGVIEPVDDIRVSNPPVNAPLMDALAKRLVATNFDLRSLVRDICNSRVYQLSSQPSASNKLDTRQFSRSYLRRLRADVLIDSFVAVTGMERGFNGWQNGTKAIDFYPHMGGDTARAGCGDTFLETFGRSSRKSVSSTETKLEPTLSQILHLMIGNTIEPRLGANGRLKTIVETSDSPQTALERLFILALSRKPTESEATELRTLIGAATSDESVYQDIFWSLLNSTEFSFNH